MNSSEIELKPSEKLELEIKNKTSEELSNIEVEKNKILLDKKKLDGKYKGEILKLKVLRHELQEEIESLSIEIKIINNRFWSVKKGY